MAHQNKKMISKDLAEFDKWLLNIGDGFAYYDFQTEQIEIPTDLMLKKERII